MKELDKLPKECFEYKFTQDKPQYSKINFWVLLIAFGFFEFFLQSAVSYYSCDLVGKFTMNILWFLTLLWLLICVFFSSNKRLIKHRPAYIICHIIASAFLRIILLLGFTMFSASTMSDGWYNVTVGNITYIVAAFILIEEFIVNILAWKRTRKCIIAGDFKSNGNGFFGKYKERAEKVWVIVNLISRFGITLSLASIPLSRIIRMANVHIEWKWVYIPLVVFLFFVYHFLLYVSAYSNSIMFGRYYYVKRFEQSTPEFKEDKEYGIGFAFTRFILAVIIIIALYIFAVKIGQGM